MEVVIEKVSKKGKVLSRYKGLSFPIALGRALNNDVIVEDKYVSAQHAEISCEDGSYFVEDMQSLNGVKILNKKLLGKQRIGFNDIIQIGKTYFQITPVNVDVSPAQKINPAEQLMQFLAQPFTLIICAMLILMAYFYGEWSTSFYEQAVSEHMLMPLFGFAFLLLIPTVFYVISRFVSNDASFLLLVGVVLFFAVIFEVFSGLFLPMMQYEIGSEGNVSYMKTAIYLLLSILLLALLFYISISFSMRKSILFACLIVLVIYGFVYFSDKKDEDEYPLVPTYESSLSAPMLQIKSGVDEQAYSQAINDMFVELKNEAAD